MTKQIQEINGARVAVITSDTPIIADRQSALDLVAALMYEDECSGAIINKAAFDERMFVLSSGIAGEVLQRFTSYRMRLAIVGDFEQYTSKPLRDFIRESNRGGQVAFVPDHAAAEAFFAQ